ncbi:hypothetical protein CAEBREN_07476 [Caenorhabditis brenneri]|uniref:Uncharacterized protein n=1 Tax=Caenorhabditis brenneri TaxID=135651 RepID=G0NNB7_CAEBE|nr:hypothetical protein CAEBREN_07476 [Caenorhabditis brenneri]
MQFVLLFLIFTTFTAKIANGEKKQTDCVQLETLIERDAIFNGSAVNISSLTDPIIEYFPWKFLDMATVNCLNLQEERTDRLRINDIRVRLTYRKEAIVFCVSGEWLTTDDNQSIVRIENLKCVGTS